MPRVSGCWPSSASAKVVAFGMRDGRPLAALDTCGDADDVFVDTKRDRVYVACGDGFLDLLASRSDGYVSIARIPTAAGARTALFVPEIDRLMLAVRASTASPQPCGSFVRNRKALSHRLPGP